MVAQSGCFCRRCFLKRIFIDDGIIDFRAGVFGVVDDSCDSRFNVVISTLKSIIAESDNRQNRMMFKLAVEIAIMQNLVALQQDIDPLSLERLRGDCVKEVKRLNGSFSFEDALDWQKD